MLNDVDIEMMELTAAANHAAAQGKGSVELTADIRKRVVSDAVAHLHFTGGESSFDAVMATVEDMPEVRFTTDDIAEMQWAAWDLFQLEDENVNWG